jgi:hypothetical protein
LYSSLLLLPDAVKQARGHESLEVQ